jgi:dihydrofolate reductase
MTSHKIAAIVAMDEGRVIGKAGALPWHLPEDLAHFKRLTTGHIVIMGRKTWDSLPAKFRPLPGRTNIVISRSPQELKVPQGVYACSSVTEAISMGDSIAAPSQILWIIGGAQIYKESIPLCDELYVTAVHGYHVGDAHLPDFESSFAQVDEEMGEACTFKTYRRLS